MSAADSVKRDAAEQVEASNDSMDAHSEKADATTARELKDAVHLAVGNGEMPEAGQSPPPAAATTTTTTSTMGEHETSPVVSVHTIPGKGRGVFAGQDIARGTEIEEAPCIAFPPPQYAAHLKHTELEHYLFLAFDENPEDPLNTNPKVVKYLLALGLGSLFNHSKHNNVSYVINSDKDTITYKTTRDIEKGEELCIFYGFDLWFKPVGEEESDSAW
eukprot:INCI14154.2.p2 GENE.INCI14154.2~~INCI14154.2.p2  ORF type:complete len:217 (+),score=34.38 INCI14154.2:210-860(+)